MLKRMCITDICICLFVKNWHRKMGFIFFFFSLLFVCTLVDTLVAIEGFCVHECLLLEAIHVIL